MAIPGFYISTISFEPMNNENSSLCNDNLKIKNNKHHYCFGHCRVPSRELKLKLLTCNKQRKAIELNALKRLKQLKQRKKKIKSKMNYKK